MINRGRKAFKTKKHNFFETEQLFPEKKIRGRGKKANPCRTSASYA